MLPDAGIVGRGRFATDEAGFTGMLAYVRRWPDRTWAIVGGEGIGRHVAQRLVGREETMIDLPAELARMRVYATGQGGKTDDTDAHFIALVGMRGLHTVVDDEQLEVLRLLVDRRGRVGADHTGMVCRLHGLLLELIPGGAKRDLSAAWATTATRRRDLAGP